MSEATEEPFIDPELAKFRQKTGNKFKIKSLAVPYSKREILATAMVAITLAFVPWDFGGVRLMSTIRMDVLALLCLATLFIPMQRKFNTIIPSNSAEDNWLAMLRFPVFWVGLLLVGYVLVAGFNPMYSVVHQIPGPDWWRGAWYLKEHVPIKWLPTSVSAPIDMNPFRYAMILCAPWLVATVIWVVLRKRQLVLAVFWILCITATANTLVGILQHLVGTDKMLFRFPTPGIVSFFSTFYYANHSAAYITLSCGVTGFLLLHTLSEAQTTRDVLKLPLILAATVLIYPVAILLNESRQGLVAVLLLCGVVYSLSIFQFIRMRNPLLLFGSLGATALAVLIFIGIAITVFPVEKYEEDLIKLGAEFSQYEKNPRYELILATSRMVADNPVFGWGPGSFRYIFPPEGKGYQVGYFSLKNAWLGDRIGRAFYRYAHCDYLQVFAELGIAGAGLLLLAPLLLVAHAIKHIRKWRTSLICLWSSMLAVLAMAVFDFPFHNPAVLLNFACLLTLSVRYLSAEEGSGQPMKMKVTA